MIWFFQFYITWFCLIRYDFFFIWSGLVWYPFTFHDFLTIYLTCRPHNTLIFHISVYFYFLIYIFSYIYSLWSYWISSSFEYRSGGFFSCRAGEMITGYAYDDRKSSTGYNKFKFQRVSNNNVQRALQIVHLSDQIKNIQKKYTGTKWIFRNMLYPLI